MPSLVELMGQLKADIADWQFDDLPLVAEPGRVIVARSISLIVRVLLKKGRRLYINDGIWASLSDSWTGKITLPARFIPDPARKTRAGQPDKIVPSRSAAQPATALIFFPGLSGCRRQSTRETGSRLAISVPTACRFAQGSMVFIPTRSLKSTRRSISVLRRKVSPQ